jgi:ABC-2 type transport system permease protein
MRSNRIFAIARKEILHILRDPRTLSIVIIMPVLQLLIFGYALNLEIQRIDMAVIDYSRTPASEEFVQAFEGSKYFQTFQYEQQPSKIEYLFWEKKARVALIIPQDFAKQLQRDSEILVQIIIDAADPNAAASIQNYCKAVINNYNQAHNTALALPFNVEPTIWFNPDLKSSYFFVPGILALLLIMISALLTSITITREKETGTMEQILVSPVRPHEIIVGKVLPYVFLAYMDASLILLTGIILFGVPFVGSVGLLAGLTLLYIITGLSLGLMISTVAPSQQVAMMAALTATLLPTLMLSGFIFPISSMPKPLQIISNIIPAKYYLIMIRGIMLKGNTLVELFHQAAVLGGMSLLFLVVAWKRFHLTMDK